MLARSLQAKTQTEIDELQAKAAARKTAREAEERVDISMDSLSTTEPMES